MKKLLSGFLIATLTGLVGAPGAFASDDEKFDPVHHAADGYYIDLEPGGKLELPRIFLIRTAEGSIGLEIYGSTAAALRSGHYLAELEEGHGGAEEEDHSGTENENGGEHSDGASDSHAAATDVETLIAAGTHLDAHLVPAQGSLILDLSVTRHLVFGVLALLIVMLVFIPLGGRYKRGIGRETAPRGLFQNMMESMVVFVRDDIARSNIKQDPDRFLPFLLSIFFFVLVANLMGLVPHGAAATSNITVTGLLAFFTFVLVSVNASRDFWIHIFWPPGVPGWIKIILVPVEIIGLLSKHMVLCMRLFANMLGGAIVIFGMIGLVFMGEELYGVVGGWAAGLISVILSVVTMFIKILVALIQAYIFALLSALFIGMAMEDHGDHHTAEATPSAH